MDKAKLVFTEQFASETEVERRELLQAAVDQYVRLRLEQPDTPEGETQ